jgi:DNA-binding beta-propeller fold protein YncE
MKLASITLIAMLLVGCAAAPRMMQYYPESADASSAIAWPDSTQLPRLEYAGQLIGEDNFVVKDQELGRGTRLLRWIVGLTGGGNDSKQLIRPQSGTVDPSGKILVTDAGRHAIFVFDEAQADFDIWYDAAPGVEFLSPVGIAVASNGDLIIADAELAEVFVLSNTGVPIARFGRGTLIRPTGVSVDRSNGEIYVADTGAHEIKVFSAHFEFLRSIGIPGSDPGQLNSPMHISVRGDRLYVSDTLNARVQIYSILDGTLQGVVGARGTYVGNMVRPKGVAVDSDGNIYVVESYHDHLLVYDSEGRFLLPIGGNGTNIGQFFLPAGAWSDSDDRIFVADMFNGRVVIFQFVGG